MIITLKNEVRATCTCGKTIAIGFTEDSNRACVLHMLPTCKLYDQYESPIDYLEALNNQLKLKVS